MNINVSHPFTIKVITFLYSSLLRHPSAPNHFEKVKIRDFAEEFIDNFRRELSCIEYNFFEFQCVKGSLLIKIHGCLKNCFQTKKSGFH